MVLSSFSRLPASTFSPTISFALTYFACSALTSASVIPGIGPRALGCGLSAGGGGGGRPGVVPTFGPNRRGDVAGAGSDGSATFGTGPVRNVTPTVEELFAGAGALAGTAVTPGT